MGSKRKLTPDEMLEAIGDTPEAQAKVERLQKTVELVARQLTRNYVIPTGKGNTIRFGLVGDHHYGSLYARGDAFEAYVKQAAEEGYTTILSAGDVLDGWRMYRGHEFELRDHGFDRQRDRFADEAPRLDGVRYEFISGNHDHSFKAQIGMEPGPQLEAARPDWHFLGPMAATVTLRSPNKRECKVDLLHPSGGTAYAMSYRPQKYVEAMAGGTKPDILAIGHYHKAEHIPQYRNVAVLQVGCFQSQTPNYMKPKGLAAHIGGWLVEVVLGDRRGLSDRIKAEFIGFFEPMPDE